MNYVLAPTQNDIVHSAKGTTWKKHKYVEIKNGRYIYKNTEANRRKKISTEYKRNTAKNEAAKELYDEELKTLNNESQLEEINRPLTVKIQKGVLNTWLSAMDLIKKTGIFDKAIEKERLEEEAAALKAQISAKNFRAVEDIIKAESIKKGAEMVEWSKDYKQKQAAKALYDRQEEINKDLEKKAREREKKERSINFRNRISIRR